MTGASIYPIYLVFSLLSTEVLLVYQYRLGYLMPLQRRKMVIKAQTMLETVINIVLVLPKHLEWIIKRTVS